MLLLSICQKKCINSFFLDTVGAEIAIETAKQAIRTANNGLNLYNKVLDQFIPWKSFKETIQRLRTSNNGYSNESKDLIGDVLRKLMDVIDEYDNATQCIFEWCGTSKPLLDAYITLFNDGNKSQQTAQTNCIIQLLDTQYQAINNSQTHLSTCVENLDMVSKHLTSLKFHLNKDFDENGEYFQHKIKQILRESHDPAAKSCKWTSCCGKGSSNIDSTEEKVIRELKEKLKGVSDFYENLKVQVVQASIDVKLTQEKLSNQMKMNDEHEARVSKSKSYVVNSDVIELQNTVIESANNLIASCDEYRNNHPVL